MKAESLKQVLDHCQFDATFGDACRDEDRLPLESGQATRPMQVKFHTLGCYPLTDAIESSVQSIPAIIPELLGSSSPERIGRLIGNDQTGLIENQKQESYF